MAGDEISNIVFYWLQHLHLEYYFPQFIDHGYDHLETVKCIAEEDLEVIGVKYLNEKRILLEAVQYLREQGGAWVYFLPHTAMSNAEAQNNLYSGTNHKTNSQSSGVGSWQSSDWRVSDNNSPLTSSFGHITVKAEIAPVNRDNNRKEHRGEDTRLPCWHDKSVRSNPADLIDTCVTYDYERFQAERNLFGFIKNVLGCGRNNEDSAIYCNNSNMEATRK